MISKTNRSSRTVMAIMMTAAIMVIVSRCSADNNGDSLSTNIEGNTIVLPTSSGGIKSFQLNASADWQITTDSEWLSLSPDSGNGDKAILMRYSENDEETVRVATFTIKSQSGESLSYAVTQPAGSKGSEGTHGYSWLELPEIKTSDTELFVTHYVTLKGVKARNYSMLYDSENLSATWVAYPLHKVYFGNSGRTDAWNWDPKVPQSMQTLLSRGFGSGYDRGHQIASADRTATDEMNEQTFFFTNMTPQLNSLNAYEWASLESWMRNNAEKISDTLYVVTGAIYQTVGGNETVKFITNKNDNKQVPVPNYYYKVAMKRKGASSYTAIGFWYKHAAASGSITASKAVTVHSIEQKTGINFFANLPEDIQNEIEANVTASDWKF